MKIEMTTEEFCDPVIGILLLIGLLAVITFVSRGCEADHEKDMKNAEYEYLHWMQTNQSHAH